jgi:hypothetical protein
MRQKTLTAYHEAGHAVLSHFLGVGLKRVTVIQDGDSLGNSVDGGEFGADAEELKLCAEEAFWIRMATARYAGAEAVRRRAPKSRWKSGADNDYNWAEIALEKITDDRQSLRALQTYAMRRARLLVAHYWPEIEQLACVLAREKTIEGRDAVKEILVSFNARRAGLLSY